MNGNWVARRRCSRRLSLASVIWLIATPLFSQDTVLISTGDDWTFFRGTEEPPPNWNEVGFDDSSWEQGPSGFGYGDNDDATVISDMQNSYLSLYIRKEVQVASVSDIAILQLAIDYDDGFVAYFNGIEVARVGLAGNPPPFNETAASHEATGALQTFTFPASAMLALQQGTNVLAIQGHNQNLTSSDFTLIPELHAYAEICPFDLTCSVLSSGSVRLRWQTPIRLFPFDSVEILRNGEFLDFLPNPQGTAYTDSDPLPGQNTYQVVSVYNGEECSGDGAPSCRVPQGTSFRRGDADDNEQVNLTDAIFLLQGLFQGGSQPVCLDAADADDNGQVNLTDAIFILQHLFQGGVAPPAPGPTDCGEDGVEDELSDCDYTSC